MTGHPILGSTTPAGTPHPSIDLRSARWHRPLLALAVVMAVLAVATTAGAILDPRQVTGAEVWLKPLKFALSTGIYAVTLAWLISGLPSGTRISAIARVAGTIAALGLGIEIVIIDTFALLGQTSHFNVSTPVHATAWTVMAVSIAVVWIMTLIVAVALFRAPLGDAARTVAIRSGVVLALIGMALAFLMTGPTAAQLRSYHGIVGAHTVGVADGGPGLPLLGWSTVGGDLRIPHFVGMHALQVLPLAVLVLELLAVRVAVLRPPVRRLRLVVVVTATYAATLAVLTAQALTGQSVIAPQGAIAVAAVAIVVLALAAAVAALAVPVRTRRPPVPVTA